MKRILLLIIITIPLLSYSQVKKAPIKKLVQPAKPIVSAPVAKEDYGITNPTSEIIKRAAKENVVHDILFGISMPSDNVRAEKMAELLKVKVETWNNTDSVMTEAEQKFIKTNIADFSNYYNGISKYGDMYASYYFGGKKEIPIGFGIYDGGLTFVQYGVFSDMKYNTTRTNGDERAISAIKRTVLPSLFNFQPLLKIKSIQNFCLVVGYTAQNFSDKYFHKGETSAIIISREILEKFINAELSETEILSKVSFFTVNESTNENLKKLTL